MAESDSEKDLSLERMHRDLLHEISTPVSIIIGMAEMTIGRLNKDAATNTEIIEKLKKVIKAAEKIEGAIIKSRGLLPDRSQSSEPNLVSSLIKENKEYIEVINRQQNNLAASAKLSSLGEMAAGVAHEINNPLAIILLNAELLKELISGTFNKEAGLKITEKILVTGARISKIIKNLRAFSRSTDSDPLSSVSVSQIIEQTVELCREKFGHNNVSLTVENPLTTTQIECREVQIVQVLMNLVNNAFDAIENLQEKWIKIESKDLGQSIEFSVTDSGSGIPQIVKDKKFQTFITTKSAERGTGLGLYISKRIVESHLGTFSLDENSKNTRFVFTILKHHGGDKKKVG